MKLSWYALPVLLASCFSCAPRFAGSFVGARITESVYTEVSFDDIRLTCLFPGDVEMVKKKNVVRKAVRKRGSRQIIMYGATSIEPFYEVLILQDPQVVPAFDLVCDTILNGKRLVIGGNGLKDPIPGSDFKFILENISVVPAQ